jgi:uncharacterized protein involved in exopolysaccharide biosynthesis
MPDISLILQKRWKEMTALTIAAMVVALVVLLLLPKQYLSTATALPANSVGADKGSVFSSSIQQLYSSLGSPGELDRFIGTGRLDTIYIAVAGALNLQQHYGIKQNDHALYSAAEKLKKNTRIDRTEFGELQVQVWDKDKHKAATLANRIMQQLQQLHQRLQNQSNQRVLQQLIQTYAWWNTDTSRVVRSGIDAELRAQNEKLVAQYRMMVEANPRALLVVESARPAIRPDKPYMRSTLLLTFFAALLFSFLVALLLEKGSAKNV